MTGRGRAGGRGWDGREIGRSGRLYVRRAAVRHQGDRDGAARASPRLRNIFSQFCSVEKYLFPSVVCLFCCSLSLIRWALQVMRDAHFSLAKSSRHVLGKNSFTTKVCEIGPKSEHGHVHHVPKAPSEGETPQKNTLPFCFLKTTESVFEDQKLLLT